MYTRQVLRDLSDFSIKQINDNFMALFYKISGNIDTIDLKNGIITTPKIADGAVTADKITTGSISVGHLDSEFIENFPLLENPVFISYANELAIIDGHVQQHGTLIQQNADTIALQAIVIDGLVTDLSSLTVRADEIASVVASNREYVDNEIIRINDEFATVNTTITNQYSTLTQRADEIETNVSNLTTTVITNYDNLTGEISSLSTIVTENYSILTQRADRIESTVSSISHSVDGLEDDMDWAYSQITQLADEITAKVTIGDVVNYLSVNRSGVQIHAGNIDLTGITTIYADGDDRTYARFDRYGDFYITYLGNEIFKLYNGISSADIYLMDNLWIRYGTLGDIFAYREWTFEDDVYFDGDATFRGWVDFSNAYVYGLDMDIDTSYLIECYYSSNKCYLDLSSAGTHIIVRDRYGNAVGRINIE